MKTIYIFLMVLACSFSAVHAAEDAPAVLKMKDGKALRVFLLGLTEGQLTLRLDKGKVSKTVAVSDVEILNFTHAKYDPDVAQGFFDQADYAAVVGMLDPVLKPYTAYISVTNSQQDIFGLLLEAYCLNENYADASRAATALLGTLDPELKLKAEVFGALAYVGLGDFPHAQDLQKEMTNPAAALYVQAVMERAQGEPREAIQTAVEIISQHVNDMMWLPSAELLCAELYLEMGMTNSALVTARQTEKLYVGTHIGKEAEALFVTLDESTNDSE